MTKFVKKIIFTFVLMLPVIIYGKGISISCNKTSINVNESVNCVLVGNSDVDVTGLEAKLSSDSSINISGINLSSGWLGDADLFFELYTGDPFKNNFNIASFTITGNSSGNYKVYVKDVKFSNDDNTFNISNSELIINVSDIKSANNTLKDIKISNTNFKYDASKTDFSISVANNVKEVDVTAVKPDAGAIVTGEKKYTLNEGKNIISLYCKAENGATKKYTITITRLAKSETQNSGESDKKESTEEKKDDSKENNTSSNNYLSKLEIKEDKISFNKSLTNYNVSVESNIDKLTIEYKTEDDKSSVEIKGNENFKTGKNKVEIIVKSEDGKTRTYTINVDKKEEKIVLENDKSKIIESINDNENTSTIYVNVKENDQNKNIDKDVLSAINEKDKTVVYQIIDDNDKIVYSLTANKGNISNLESLNYNIDIENKNNDLDKLVNGKYLLLNFEKQSKTANKIKFRINLNNTDLKDTSKLYLYKYDSESVNLSNASSSVKHKYDTDTEKLKMVSDNVKIENGYAIIEVDDFSKYVLTDYDNALKEVVPQKSGNRLLLIIVLVVLLALGITIMVIVSEKKKKTKTVNNA